MHVTVIPAQRPLLCCVKIRVGQTKGPFDSILTTVATAVGTVVNTVATVATKRIRRYGVYPFLSVATVATVFTAGATVVATVATVASQGLIGKCSMRFWKKKGATRNTVGGIYTSPQLFDPLPL